VHHHSPLPALVLLSFVPLAPLAAQEGPPKPAEQVAKFDVLLGSWEGSGTVQHGPGGEQSKWICKVAARRALGGHVVREETRIEIEGAPGPLWFVTLYGWDRETQRYVRVESSNFGAVQFSEVFWTGPKEMVTSRADVMEGKPFVERWVHRFDGAAWHFECQQAEGSAEIYTHVVGDVKRTSEKPSDLAAVEAAFMPEMAAGGAPHMKKLARSAGSYQMKGWFKMAPDAPQTPFTGSEQVRAMYGGSVIEFAAKGDEVPGFGAYESLGWMAWDAHGRCYRMVFANNMGEIGEQECRFSGDQRLVTTSASMSMGKPVTMRSVIEIGDDGAFQRFAGDMMMDTAAPGRFFEATYERK
jgi:hypothetical protein